MTSTSGFPDAKEKWAEKIRRGDRAAFEALYLTYAEGLCSFTLQYVKAPEVAEGLVQDLFVKLWKRRRQWNPQDNPKSYLYTAARNQALDHLKHLEVERQWAEHVRHRSEVPSRTPEQEFRYKEFNEAVEEAIQALPERRRLVFTLSRQHGLTYREIAEVMDISVKTVEAQMSQAFKTLRELLSTYLSVAPLLPIAPLLFWP